MSKLTEEDIIRFSELTGIRISAWQRKLLIEASKCPGELLFMHPVCRRTGQLTFVRKNNIRDNQLGFRCNATFIDDKEVT